MPLLRKRERDSTILRNFTSRHAFEDGRTGFIYQTGQTINNSLFLFMDAVLCFWICILVVYDTDIRMQKYKILINVNFQAWQGGGLNPNFLKYELFMVNEANWLHEKNYELLGF